jgi:chaperonin GroES
MADYLNWKLFYGIEGWEQDTDAMLLRLPAVGQHYRKVYGTRSPRPPVHREHLGPAPDHPGRRAVAGVVAADHPRLRPLPVRAAGSSWRAASTATSTLTPRRRGRPGPRIILEQHRMMDLDEDGLDEPYIVTVDAETEQVLRIEEAFDDEASSTTGCQIVASTAGVRSSRLRLHPRPQGPRLRHRLRPPADADHGVVNTTINMQIDAGHAQVAGGGFIGAEVRLQGAGQNGVLRFQPGEYKTVNATGADLRNAIYERTFPEPSEVLFQLLGMLMEAAKDIASVNEAITGDAARTAPVGTTLALIEQGQQVFNGIYKRIYRALREEFKLFADCIAKYGGEEAAQEYARFCDVEPETR